MYTLNSITMKCLYTPSGHGGFAGSVMKELMMWNGMKEEREGSDLIITIRAVD